MRMLKFVGIFLAGVIVGGVAVGWWWGNFFARTTVGKETEVAFQAAQDAEWLAELRLGEVTNTIHSMENEMDIGVVTISQWNTLGSPDEQTRRRRDAFLTAVKVYHQSYPPRGAEAGSISSFLAAVPGRSPQSTCKSGLCRLDDLRLAKVRSVTNSP
jgi:hypothetical protein